MHDAEKHQEGDYTGGEGSHVSSAVVTPHGENTPQVGQDGKLNSARLNSTKHMR